MTVFLGKVAKPINKSWSLSHGLLTNRSGFPLRGKAIPQCRATSIRHVRQKTSRNVSIGEFGVSTPGKILAASGVSAIQLMTLTALYVMLVMLSDPLRMCGGLPFKNCARRNCDKDDDGNDAHPIPLRAQVSGRARCRRVSDIRYESGLCRG